MPIPRPRPRSETCAPTRAAAIALDLGGTKLASAIVTSTGRMVRRNLVFLQRKKGKEVGHLICNELANLLRHAIKKKINIRGIGISVPGISDEAKGTVWAPNIRGWRKYPLKREVQKALCQSSEAKFHSHLPITIANDRACYILGEAWLGRAKGCSNAIFLAVGTGIGAGIIVNGSILQGAHGIAGAIGWMALDRPFRSEYKGCGCFESHASGAALSRFNALTLQRPHVPTVFSAGAAGNLKAKQVLRTAVEYWGMAVANLVSLFNPGTIVFGGGIFGPATKLIPAICKEAQKWAQPIAMKQVKLQPSKLGPDAGLLGAAYLAMTGAGTAWSPHRNRRH